MVSQGENGRINVPQVTATIGFSGSSSDMQVGSSTLCATTGQLVIESEAANIDPEAVQTKRLCSLTTKWREERPSADVNCRPHLTIGFPDPDPTAYKIPLASMNRDSRLVQETKATGMDECDTSISTIDSPIQHPSPPSRGTSAVWSSSGAAAMPEIVELFVSLKAQDASTDGQVWQGIAYLVVFGHEDDRGTSVMELQVKKPPHSDSNGALQPTDIFLAPQARLRIEVKVIHKQDKKQSERIRPHHKEVVSSSYESHEDVVFSRTVLDAQMEALRRKIQEKEDIALQNLQDQKSTMEVNMPMEEDHLDGNNSSCNVLWSWDRIVGTLSSAIRRCDEGTAAVAAVSEESSDCSTIATRHSWDI
jgi:hypothetical protein